MKKIKQLLCSLLAVIMLMTAVPVAFAAVNDTGFSDISANAWYADAVQYVVDNGLMNGTSATTFSPDETVTRAMLATILYRIAGSPAVTGTDTFSDTVADAYYSDAVVWASTNGIISGYENGMFGTNDLVSHQQIATILWRYAGSPSADAGQDFADENTIAAYATTAVDWVRSGGIMSGKTGNRFDPNGNTTRAQFATILHNYMTMGQNSNQTPNKSGNTLVVYFSMPETTNPSNMTTEEANSTVVVDNKVLGNTQYMAQVIQEITGGDIFRIESATPYPTNHSTLVDLAADEQNENARPAIANQISNLDDYDTIFIGYPIWWSDMPMILYTFFDTYDFSGKTIVPFGTHGGSGFAGTTSTIQRLEPNAVMLNGLIISRNSIQEARTEIENWVNNLK